jgi:hypothetical protein
MQTIEETLFADRKTKEKNAPTGSHIWKTQESYK